MTIHVKVAGVWRDVDEPLVKNAGAWKPSEVWVKVAGVWRRCMPLFPDISGSFQDPQYVGGQPTRCHFIARSDGNVAYSLSTEGFVENVYGSWVSPPSMGPGPYYIRANLLSGSLYSGTVGTDLALTASRVWTVDNDGSGPQQSASLEILIKDASGGNVLSDSTVNIEAQFIA